MTIEPNGYKILKDENAQLKNDLLRTEELQDEIIQLEEEKRYWLDNFKRVRDDKMKIIDEHEQLKQRVLKLVRTNTTLQNDLFSEQLLQDETEEYINRLKQELFNLYLNHYN